MYTYDIFTTHSSSGQSVGCFPFLTIVNRAEMTVSLCQKTGFFGCVLRSGVAGSYDSSIVLTFKRDSLVLLLGGSLLQCESSRQCTHYFYNFKEVT